MSRTDRGTRPSTAGPCSTGERPLRALLTAGPRALTWRRSRRWRFGQVARERAGPGISVGDAPRMTANGGRGQRFNRAPMWKVLPNKQPTGRKAGRGPRLARPRFRLHGILRGAARPKQPPASARSAWESLNRANLEIKICPSSSRKGRSNRGDRGPPVPVPRDGSRNPTTHVPPLAHPQKLTSNFSRIRTFVSAKNFRPCG